MKSPFLALLFFAPLHPVALGCDKSDCSAVNLTRQPAPAKITTRPAPTTATPAPAPRTGKPRPTPSSRPPAHLFM